MFNRGFSGNSWDDAFKFLVLVIGASFATGVFVGWLIG